jgi:hypothetical protein
MKYIALFILFLFSCTKQEQSQSEVSQPILIQVEAVHSDGNIVLSPIAVAR